MREFLRRHTHLKGSDAQLRGRIQRRQGCFLRESAHVMPHGVKIPLKVLCRELLARAAIAVNACK